MDFHQERRTGLGGTDAAPALGLSERKTALDVYLEKRGEIAPIEDSEVMKWGRLLEPVVRQEYAERTGYVVTQPRDMLRHDKYPFIIGHPDGLVMSARRGWEGKTARNDRGWGEPGTDQIPQDHIIQVQQYMLITALPVWDVSVLIGGQHYRQYEVPADAELHEMIVEAEHDLWQRVLKGEPPEPDWQHKRTLDAVRALYPGTDGTTIDASEQLARWYAVLQDASHRESQYKALAENAKAHLLYEMGESAILKFPDGKCMRRKETKRKGYVVEDSKYMDARIVNAKE